MAEKYSSSTYENLRIVPEALFTNLKNGIESLPNEAHLGDVLIWDPRSLTDLAKIERDLSFFKFDRLIELIRKATDKAEEPKTKEMIDFLFPDEKANIIFAGLSEIGRISILSEKEAAAAALLRKADILPKAQAILHEGTRIKNSASEDCQESIAHLDKLAKQIGPEGVEIMWDGIENFRKERAAFQARSDAFQLKDSAVRKMERDEAKALAAFNQLPRHLRDAFMSEPQTIAITATAIDEKGSLASILMTQNILLLSQEVLDEKALPVALKEEMLHWIDNKIGFSKRGEWKNAVAKEIQSMSAARLEIIKKALGGESTIFDLGEDEIALAKLDTNSISYDSPEGKEIELLVDYFHVRDYLSGSQKPMSVDALNAKMAKIFPHTHSLCRQFEQEIMRLAKIGPDRGDHPQKPKGY